MDRPVRHAASAFFAVARLRKGLRATLRVFQPKRFLVQPRVFAIMLVCLGS